MALTCPGLVDAVDRVYHQGMTTDSADRADSFDKSKLGAFSSAIVDRARQCGGVLDLPGGQLVLPKVFGFCRGVERALEILDQAVTARADKQTRLFLLGQIIHNPWVNEYFSRRGVRVLSADQRDRPEEFITSGDCAVIPAFGVPPTVLSRIERIGCEIVDTTCGDVRRLWKWAEQASAAGYGVMIFGRASHDETVVTKSRLAAAGGKYVVAVDIEHVMAFGELIARQRPSEQFAGLFETEATNAGSLEPFLRLAQVSQTTMLYDDTMEVQALLRAAYTHRFGDQDLSGTLLVQRTVCRATQARQSAAVDLVKSGCDLAIVVGGFTSSNTRNLFELAQQYSPAYFIESAEAIRSAHELDTYDFDTARPTTARDWLAARRPLKIAVLAGASSPEIVVGQVMAKLAELLDSDA